jgi:lipopolysaccharide/colanic/teichoic acid biosynthesis glycosyltransferase
MRADAERLKANLRQFSEQDGPAFKLANDPRITPIGRYLRKTCIDELPQLWNVIKGDMTLVGPRPLDSKEAAKIEGWGRRRAEVTPGLTCIWQVYGKAKVTFDEWMRMDIRYIKRRSVLRDLRLIWGTIVAVIRHRASV